MFRFLAMTPARAWRWWPTGPGVIPAGRVCDDLVDFSDSLPTCRSAIGADVPDGLDGQSLLKFATGQSE